MLLAINSNKNLIDAFPYHTSTPCFLRCLYCCAGCNDDHAAPCNDQRLKYADTLKMVCTSPKACTLPKASTLSMPNGVYVIKGEYGKYAKEDASVKEGHNKHLTKEGDNKPLAKDGNWLGTTMSPLPQGQLAVYIMHDNNQPIATKGLRTVYAMQGNNEPLITIGDWAMTFNDCEGTKALMIELVAPIVTPYHCNEVP